MRRSRHRPSPNSTPLHFRWPLPFCSTPKPPVAFVPLMNRTLINNLTLFSSKGGPGGVWIERGAAWCRFNKGCMCGRSIRRHIKASLHLASIELRGAQCLLRWHEGFRRSETWLRIYCVVTLHCDLRHTQAYTRTHTYTDQGPRVCNRGMFRQCNPYRLGQRQTISGEHQGPSHHTHTNTHAYANTTFQYYVKMNTFIEVILGHQRNKKQHWICSNFPSVFFVW